jgi:hypothetical protein
MDDTSATDAALWAATVARARRELAALPAAERAWLARQVSRISRLQQRLDRLFHALNGPQLCAICSGGCCGCAKHHATLTNLLGYLLTGTEPPSPDFGSACPFLGERGCRLPAAHRPFNCIIFFCEALDGRLSAPQRHTVVRTETVLRATYQAVADRCPGASLRGLLMAATRAGNRPLLVRAA